MTPEDPRHGTTRGFHAGCRERCCRAAINRYEKHSKILKLRGQRRSVPALGAQRRIRALMALGWTSTDIADAAGWTNRNQVLRILNGQKSKPTTWLERATHERVCAVYDRLSMRLPEPAPHRTRTQQKAQREGWPPPLWWDDIDDPAEQPRLTRDKHVSPNDVDEAVVLRVLAGEKLPTTRAEKDEITRRWVAAGRSMNDLERIHGWRVSRYGREAS